MDLDLKLSRRIIAFAEKCPTAKPVEFGLLTGAAIGGAFHVGTNAIVKGMLKPNSWRQRIGSALFQTGVRHKAAGTQIHPFVQRMSDSVLGPEISHLYKAGMESTRAGRKAITAIPTGAGAAGGVSGLVGGKRAGWLERAMNSRFMPKAKIARGEKARDWGGAAVGGGLLTAAMHDPIIPALNIGRTLIAKSSFGNKFLRKEAEKGAQHGVQRGVARTVKDYLVSPSLGIARDLGAGAHPFGASAKAATAVKDIGPRIPSHVTDDDAAAKRLLRLRQIQGVHGVTPTPSFG